MRNRRHIGPKSCESPSPEGYGQYRSSYPHPVGMCVDMAFLDVQVMKLPGWSCAAPFLFVTSRTAEYLMAKSDQDSVRAAGGASSSIRNTGVKEVMLGQRVYAAYVPMHKL
eukprot:1138713-Pelagomonas_calceolata.AAC.5